MGEKSLLNLGASIWHLHHCIYTRNWKISVIWLAEVFQATFENVTLVPKIMKQSCHGSYERNGGKISRFWNSGDARTKENWENKHTVKVHL